MSSHEKLSVVALGHGTIFGHVLFKHCCVGKEEMDRIEKKAAAMGKASFKYAYVFDMFKAERGISIDVKSASFETERFEISLIDAPGHKDFIENTIA